MKLRFLGTGDAAQVPVFGCDCPACVRTSVISSHIRRSSCCTIESQGQRLLIDAGIENLAGYLTANPVDSILLTHFHVDHVQGLFPMRWGKGPEIKVHCPDDKQGCADLYKHHGMLNFMPIQKQFEPFKVGDFTVIAVPLRHSKQTLGYCVESEGVKLAYMTDTKGFPDKTLDFLMQWQPDTLVIDASYPPTTSQHSDGKNYNHNSIDEVEAILDLFISARVKVPKMWLTHISHKLDCYLMENQHFINPSLNIASDGLTIDILPQEIPRHIGQQRLMAAE